MGYWYRELDSYHRMTISDLVILKKVNWLNIYNKVGKILNIKL